MDDTCVNIDALNHAVCLHGFVLVGIQLHRMPSIRLMMYSIGRSPDMVRQRKESFTDLVIAE